jgi:hypothetical protein
MVFECTSKFIKVIFKYINKFANLHLIKFVVVKSFMIDAITKYRR